MIKLANLVKELAEKNYKVGDKITITSLELPKGLTLPRGYEDLKVGDVITLTSTWKNATGNTLFGTDKAPKHGLYSDDLEYLTAKSLSECGDCERDGVDYTHGHDHEASMADSELRDMISNASKLQNIIQPGDELPGWVSAYITLASDYMHSVAEYMEQQASEMGGTEREPTPGYAVYETKKKLSTGMTAKQKS